MEVIKNEENTPKNPRIMLGQRVPGWEWRTCRCRSHYVHLLPTVCMYRSLFKHALALTQTLVWEYLVFC